MKIREASSGDATGIERVARASWEADYPTVLNRENTAGAATDWYDRSTLATAIERVDERVLVATVDDEVVGFAHAYVGRGRGDLLRLYVAPSFRARGIGSALLEETIDELTAAGVDAVRAMVLAANEQGRAFYESRGFELVTDDEETVIDGERHRECAYRLELSS